MQPLLLAWQSPRTAPPAVARDAIARYMDYKARFALFENGTALLFKAAMDHEEAIVGAMTELRFRPDFNVMPMKDGNYLVWLASAVCVFVSSEEAALAIESLRHDHTSALFSGEAFVGSSTNPDHHLIGLAGRAKGHRDSFEQRLILRYVPDAET